MILRPEEERELDRMRRRLLGRGVPPTLADQAVRLARICWGELPESLLVADFAALRRETGVPLKSIPLALAACHRSGCVALSYSADGHLELRGYVPEPGAKRGAAAVRDSTRELCGRRERLREAQPPHIGHTACGRGGG